MSGAKHAGLPVAGYRPQSQERVDRVNVHKQIEERLLRIIDAAPPDDDPRWLAIARTHIELGFMALNRAVFQPDRVKIDDDEW